DTRLIGAAWYRVPEMLRLGPTGASMGVGVSWSLLSLGAGLLVGFRVTLSMVVGAIVAWVVAPPLLLQHGMLDEMVRRKVLLWVMWPATGLLISGGLTALALRWRLLVSTFRNLSGAQIDGGDFPMRWVVIGSLACAVALVFVQHAILGMPVWMTVVAMLLSIPLMLVGIRVLGETNWGPISALSNMMQAIFGVVAPGHIMPNMVSSGVTGSIASESEGLIQSYKTGDMVGSTPKYLTYAQLIAVPIGAAAVAWIYPLLRDTYGIGGENGLQSPISQKWAGFAKLLSAGPSALPPGALAALAIAVVLGIVFTVLEGTRFRAWTPSPTGLGIGMLVPASAVITMFLGALAGEGWIRTSRAHADRNLVALASGFIAGEAIIAVIVPILVALRVVHLQ
ncbi:MAG TPA: OPT/YSL family transporter, partial [Candidatus Eisenbacteria bacterium]